MKQNFSSAIDEPHLHASLPRERPEKINGLAKQPVQMRRYRFRARLAVKLKDVVYRGRERPQSRLNLTDPLAGLRSTRRRIGQQARKQFEAAQRIADFMRQNRGNFREGLVSPRLFLFAEDALFLR